MNNYIIDKRNKYAYKFKDIINHDIYGIGQVIYVHTKDKTITVKYDNDLVFTHKNSDIKIHHTKLQDNSLRVTSSDIASKLDIINDNIMKLEQLLSAL